MRAAALLALVLVPAAIAAPAKVIHGTAHDDVIRGTASADRIFAGAGDDVIHAGAGNDTIVGGPGADSVYCGPGRDTVVADQFDLVAADCEKVKHVTAPEPPAPAPPPPPPSPQAGHYSGSSAQGKAFVFDVLAGAAEIDNLTFDVEQPCDNGDKLEFTGGFTNIGLGSDGVFTLTWSGTDSNLGQLSTITINGKVDTAGGATGTLQIHTDADISNVGVIHCDSGSVSWSAHVS